MFIGISLLKNVFHSLETLPEEYYGQLEAVIFAWGLISIMQVLKTVMQNQ